MTKKNPDTSELENLIEDTEWFEENVDGGLDLAALGADRSALYLQQFGRGLRSPKTAIRIDYAQTEARIDARLAEILTRALQDDGTPCSEGFLSEFNLQLKKEIDSLSQLVDSLSQLDGSFKDFGDSVDLATVDLRKFLDGIPKPYVEELEHPHLRHNPVTKGKGRPAHIDPHRRGKIR